MSYYKNKIIISEGNSYISATRIPSIMQQLKELENMKNQMAASEEALKKCIVGSGEIVGKKMSEVPELVTNNVCS